jgi:hypothetical protein
MPVQLTKFVMSASVTVDGSEAPTDRQILEAKA